MDTTNLAKRMKKYEAVSKGTLMARMPVILRLDGKAFHTYTRGFRRPFDSILMVAMQETMKYLCENIQGCVLGYTQSDEISLVLIDYKKFTSSAWFDNEIQKMVSIAASMATMEFNRVFTMLAVRDGDAVHRKKAGLAQFDCRAFNLAKEEVANCLYWRQADASRNSIQMVGQANFSHRELQNKSCNEIQDMLMLQKGINWNDLPTDQKRGSCAIKQEYLVEDGGYRTHWVIDKEIPIFKGDGRDYIEDLICVGEV